MVYQIGIYNPDSIRKVRAPSEKRFVKVRPLRHVNHIHPQPTQNSPFAMTKVL